MFRHKYMKWALLAYTIGLPTQQYIKYQKDPKSTLTDRLIRLLWGPYRNYFSTVHPIIDGKYFDHPDFKLYLRPMFVTPGMTFNEEYDHLTMSDDYGNHIGIYWAPKDVPFNMNNVVYQEKIGDWFFFVEHFGGYYQHDQSYFKGHEGDLLPLNDLFSGSAFFEHGDKIYQVKVNYPNSIMNYALLKEYRDRWGIPMNDPEETLPRFKEMISDATYDQKKIFEILKRDVKNVKSDIHFKK